MPSKKKSRPGYMACTIDFPEDLWTEVARFANRFGMSRTAVVRMGVVRLLDAERARQGADAKRPR